MIKKIFKSFFPQGDIVGVDIGSSAVKIALFQKDPKSGTKLKTWGHIPLNLKPDVQPEERKAIIAGEIEKFFKKMGIQTKYAATSVSGNAVIVRYVKLPRLSKKELDLTINVEAEPFIPFDINDIYLSYYILNENIMDEGQPKMEVVLVAAKKDLVNEKIDILTQAGLQPVIIDADSFCLENLYASLPTREENKSVLFLNIGNKVTSLSIISGSRDQAVDSGLSDTVRKKEDIEFNAYTKVVRDIFISGNSMDRAISKSLKVAPEQAQELKKTIKLLTNDEDKLEAIKNYDRQGISASKSCVTVLKALSGEVARSIDFYLSQGVDHSISKIYLSGGSGAMGNIASYLSGEFKVPVEVVNPFSVLSEPAKNIPEELLPSMAIACGLAMRKLKDWQ